MMKMFDFDDLLSKLQEIKINYRKKKGLNDDNRIALQVYRGVGCPEEFKAHKVEFDSPDLVPRDFFLSKTLKKYSKRQVVLMTNRGFLFFAD